MATASRKDPRPGLRSSRGEGEGMIVSSAAPASRREGGVRQYSRIARWRDLPAGIVPATDRERLR